MTRLLALALLALIGVGVLGIVVANPLVSMTNDHEGRAVFPATYPGQESAKGGLTIGNDGLLAYDLHVQTRDTVSAGAQLKIIRDDGMVLYEGRLGHAQVQLCQLRPGAKVPLRVVFYPSADDPVAPTLIWSAHGVLPAAPDLSGLLWPLVGLLGLLNVLLIGGWLVERWRARQIELADLEW